MREIFEADVIAQLIEYLLCHGGEAGVIEFTVLPDIGEEQGVEGKGIEEVDIVAGIILDKADKFFGRDGGFVFEFPGDEAGIGICLHGRWRIFGKGPVFAPFDFFVFGFEVGDEERTQERLLLGAEVDLVDV